MPREQYIAHDATQVTSILVRADDGVSQEELAARVAAVLPDGVEAITGRANTAQDIEDLNAQFLNAFKTFLVIFAGIALLVAAFSIHNTFSILVAQRTRESALLRTIGASRRQILTWVTLEALVLGVWASVAGLFGGIGLAQLLKLMFDAFGFALPAGGIAVDTVDDRDLVDRRRARDDGRGRGAGLARRRASRRSRCCGRRASTAPARR